MDSVASAASRGQCSARSGVQTLDRSVGDPRRDRAPRSVHARRSRPRDRPGPARPRTGWPSRSKITRSWSATATVASGSAPGSSAGVRPRAPPLPWSSRPGRCSQRLSAETGESAQLYVREGDQRVCVATPRAPDRSARHGAARRRDAAHEGFRRPGAPRLGRRPRPIRRRSRRAGRGPRRGLGRDRGRARGRRRQRERAGAGSAIRWSRRSASAARPSGSVPIPAPASPYRCSRRPPTSPALAARPSPRRNHSETKGLVRC